MQGSPLVRHVSGIHSKQPWFVLSADRYSTSLTTENPAISHFYSFIAGKNDSTTIAVPDGCVDLVFDCDADQSQGMVCGTSLEARSVEFNNNHRYFGMRFVPGYFPDFVDLSATDLIASQFDMLDVIKQAHTLIEPIINAKTFSEQVVIAKKFMQDKQGRKPNRITQQVAAKICQEKGNVQIQDLEQYTGYSSRTLQRQFKADLGMTPKAFCRAIRCQSAIYDINHNEKMSFTDLALSLGFSDQSHFLREFKKLVSTTPLDYQSKVKHTTYLERISCY